MNVFLILHSSGRKQSNGTFCSASHGIPVHSTRIPLIQKSTTLARYIACYHTRLLTSISHHLLKVPCTEITTPLLHGGACRAYYALEFFRNKRLRNTDRAQGNLRKSFHCSLLRRQSTRLCDATVLTWRKKSRAISACYISNTGVGQRRENRDGMEALAVT